MNLVNSFPYTTFSWTNQALAIILQKNDTKL